ncbi:MAG: L-2-amino-thiazoline-4-carboxylic acid hydrolase [Pseudomonadota bacterium]
MRRAFLRHLTRSIRRRTSETRVDRDELNSRADDYVSANAHLAHTAVEAAHIELVCLVLAAHDYLARRSIDADIAEKILEDAVLIPGRGFTRWATRIMLAFSRDPMATLVRFSSERIPPSYGRLFSFEEERVGSERYTMRATRCFYHAFFTRYGVPHLTHIFCRWDEAWIEPISETRHGVRFSRPETIATGAQSCPFTFQRIRARNKD